jgi:UDP-N-acetylglucosamine 4,6-dehydratase/5-epimerase
MTLDFLRGKSVLITGGTGSFGQRCIKTLLEQSEATKIIIFSRDELKQSEMQTTIFDPAERLRYFIGDIRDLPRLQRAFNGVDYVIHAAALKQVPAMEYNPFEAVKTNILGTQNVVDAAVDQKVKRVILVSTDKAANPANLYGATKLCAEKLVVNGNVYSGEGGTRFSVVRYGNVLGSRGSLLKVVEQQRASGELTITHEDMTRFWITLDQGVRFVMFCLEQMHGGEIFIPKIPSMKIKEFMLSLAPECTLKPVGIRPGEKLHEVLVTPEEARRAKAFGKHYVILPEHDDNYKQLQARYGHGNEVEEGFLYASDRNEEWLDFGSLKDLIASL